jgi:subfamily B ATP-binding cassette protein MsbA
MMLGLNADAQVVLRRLLRYVRPYVFVVVPAGLAIIVYALITAAVPLLLEGVLQQLQDTAEEALLDVNSLLDALKLPLAIAGLFALRGAMDFLTVYGLSWVGRSAIRDLRTDLFRRYLYLPAAFFDRHATGDLLSRLTFNSEQIAEALSSSIVVLVRDVLLVVFMIGVMLFVSPRLTLILAVVGPLVALLLGAMSRAFRRYSTRIQSSMGDVTRVAGQALRAHRVIKAFSGQEFETARFEAINQRNFRLHLRLVATRTFGDALTQFIVVLGISVVIFLVLSNLVTPRTDTAEQTVFDSPELLGFLAALAILMTALKRLVGTNAALQRGIAAAGSLFDILDEPAEPYASGDPAGAVERVAGALEFDAVSFRYGADQEEVLHRVSFRLDPGQSFAIVGRSGSGKSTLVSLLPRFYDISEGVIRLDARDIREYPLEVLRRQFSFVSQDVVLFDDTIAANIAYGALATVSRDEIVRAAATAYVNDFADELPAGLDTEVGESGILMSGGQRQRIAIARAVLKDAPILVLDEATSALDTESERQVQTALGELMRGRTSLVIAHRLSTVEQADCILVMRDGRIVETGTHVELLAAGGYYASLYRLQFAD